MIENLSGLIDLMRCHGASSIYAKDLAANDNSKNQIYLGPDFSALNILPHGEVVDDDSDRAGSKTPRAKAAIDFLWVDEFSVHPAPSANLILYPSYPEIRLSGLLKSAASAPSRLLSSREQGRVLFLGITDGGKVLGHLAACESSLAREARALDGQAVGVFKQIPLNPEIDTRQMLLEQLARIHRLGWIESKRLNGSGLEVPYLAQNGGGYTLEAELGIIPNGRSEPDYLGWEVKQYGVRNFVSYAAKSSVTLMTPEPSQGIYARQGVVDFLQKYGYPDRRGIPDRLNFGGIYACPRGNHPRTALKLELRGYCDGKILDIDGGIFLIDRESEVAAGWPFKSLMSHWNRKHALAAYVPSLERRAPKAYHFGSRVMLCEQADFSLFIRAVQQGIIYYDPGIKMEDMAAKPRLKRRSQFRIKMTEIPQLYKEHEFIFLS